MNLAALDQMFQTRVLVFIQPKSRFIVRREPMRDAIAVENVHPISQPLKPSPNESIREPGPVEPPFRRNVERLLRHNVKPLSGPGGDAHARRSTASKVYRRGLRSARRTVRSKVWRSDLASGSGLLSPLRRTP